MKMTLMELANSLDLPAEKIDRWIFQGRIPVRRVGQVCDFKRSSLEKWAASHNLSFSISGENPTPTPVVNVESLMAAMQRGGVCYGLDGADVETILNLAAKQVPGLTVESQEMLYQRLVERERLTSTGIGKGVAIPHPRTPLSDLGNASVLTTCFLKSPVDFGSVDDRPVFALFVLLSPSTQQHLHLLSRLAFCLRDEAFVSFLKTTPDPEALFSQIAEFELELDRSDA
ncbi:MAG: PTS sugar transporter subunit IIA [Deltaproteobacteria bacterium]|nr:PTS sugar transporter subunit IIA [Deltaproteobacteria bacterium]